MQRSDLKSIIMLSYLKEPVLEKLEKITEKTTSRAGSSIFREGDYAERLYSVLEGEVVLELAKHSDTQISVATITRGYTFGFSAIVDTEEKKYTSSARARTDTTLLAWKGLELEALCQQDHEMGFLLMKRIAKIIKTRLQTRNLQFMDIYR